MKNPTIIALAILSTALTTNISTVNAASTERCADIVKGGKNTCAVKSLGISCQGNAKEDNMVGAWIKVPTGTCGSIVAICNGDVDAPEGIKLDKLEAACEKVADQDDEQIVGGRIVNKFGESI